jgi:hypothetical protein
MLHKRRFWNAELFRVFEALFKSVTRHVAHDDVGNNVSDKYMLPKRRFWKEEQKMNSRFSIYFSMVRSPNRVLTPLQSASKIRISSFVPPSKIFVWDG